MAVAHAKEAPVPPSRKSELPIPEELDRVILDCLAKNPDDRPQSAVDLSRRLTQCQSERPWSDQLARDWWDKHLPRAKPPAEMAEHTSAQRLPETALDSFSPRS